MRLALANAGPRENIRGDTPPHAPAQWQRAPLDPDMPRTANAPSYRQRLDRVIDHIGELPSQAALSVRALARISGFSPFHFHRLFHAYTGETVHEHVRRVRVERAASLMRVALARPLTEIALEAGFPALSDLSRAFKARFGLAPSRWDRRAPLPRSRAVAAHLDAETLSARSRGLRARVGELPRALFAYTRVRNPYGNPALLEAYERTRRWIDQLELAPAEVVFAGAQLDDPAVVPAERCRYDLGVLFPFAVRGAFAEVARARGPGAALRAGAPPPAVVARAGLTARRLRAVDVAMLRIDGDLAHVEAAYQWLYSSYLPRQRRLPAHLPALELFVRLPEEIGTERFDVIGCVPLA